jgi:uncharacterized protein YdeI (YjbR/CyaY-like superfamily)
VFYVTFCGDNSFLEMGTKDDGIDAYIAKSADFAEPILMHIRKLVHQACPNVEEKLKWSCPHFDYKGPLCSMAAFKEHCAFGFWKASLIDGLKEGGDKAPAAGNFGALKKKSDLPPDKVIIGYIKQAMALNEKGIKVEKKVMPKKDLEVPDELTAALKKNKKALEVWKAFSPSKVREYAEWIVEAKTDATKARRLETAIEWIAEGKTRHWKYHTK